MPWRRTLDPYAIWVSEIMLQQTQVKTVIPYFERWMNALPNVTRLAEVSSDRLHKLWEGLGYYTRARNLQKAAQVVLTKHGRAIPLRYDEVLALPGVGRYTAGAITSIAFNQPQPIVDGNVIRVLARWFAIPGNPKDKHVSESFWARATELVETANRLKLVVPPAGSPLKFAGNCSLLNQSLMELGATICTPTNPRCEACPIQSSCEARGRDCVARFPETPKREVATARRFVAFVIRRGKRVLLRQRPAGVVNAHLWEFPNAEITIAESDPIAKAASLLGLKLGESQPLGPIRHSITRYRITLEPFSTSLIGRAPAACGEWIAFDQLPALAFTAAHRKLLKRAGLVPPR